MKCLQHYLHFLSGEGRVIFGTWILPKRQIHTKAILIVVIVYGYTLLYLISWCLSKVNMYSDTRLLLASKYNFANLMLIMILISEPSLIFIFNIYLK